MGRFCPVILKIEHIVNKYGSNCWMQPLQNLKNKNKRKKLYNKPKLDKNIVCTLKHEYTAVIHMPVLKYYLS